MIKILVHSSLIRFQKLEEELLVSNMSEQVATYEVRTDIAGFDGPKYLRLESGETKPYRFFIHAKKSGSFQKSVRFFNRSDQSYIWFDIKV